jgi:hypothetical protein
MKPIIGEPFNPWHGACGFWPEDIVESFPAKTSGAVKYNPIAYDDVF